MWDRVIQIVAVLLSLGVVCALVAIGRVLIQMSDDEEDTRA